MKKTATPLKKRDRAEDSTTITISIKKEILSKIDGAAKSENRSRSNYIITQMMQAVAKRHNEQ